MHSDTEQGHGSSRSPNSADDSQQAGSAHAVARDWARRASLDLHYGADAPKLGLLCEHFVRLGPDRGLVDYLAVAERARHGRFTALLQQMLRPFYSDFDVNGMLGIYPMHVLSTEQWLELIGERPGGRLLDIGAGRGDVTSALGACFDHVTATETSRMMAKRLERRGYEVIRGDVAAGLGGRTFDAVSLLNVLDRCDKPLSLLGEARTSLREGGLLIIALVLPYRPFVYEGPVTRPPKERLPIAGATFEAAALEFWSLALAALGLEPVAITRAPYLSGGDRVCPLYELDDLVLVARALGAPPPILGSGSTA